MNSLFAALALLLALALPAPAKAQPQIIVVPAGQGVVVPPRGAALAPVIRPAAVRRPRPDHAVAVGPVSDPTGVSPVLLLVPLVAAAILAATLSGGNEAGGSSGPVRTR